MSINELILDAFSRIREVVHSAVDGLDSADLEWRPDEQANSIAWLVWHLTRVQDDHLADAAGSVQVWTSGGWVDRFALPFEAMATGYGQQPDEVAGFTVASGSLLTGYYDAVHEQTVNFVRALVDDDLGRVIDKRWDPPVTLGVRIVSVISDDLQHAGQAEYVRGLLPSR